MKKIFTFAMMACMALSAAAQSVMTPEMMAAPTKHHHEMATKIHTMANRPMKADAYCGKYLQKNDVLKAVAEVTADTLLYIASPRTMYRGGYFTSGYETNPAFILATDSAATFYNVSTVVPGNQIGWFWNSEDPIEDDNLVLPWADLFDGEGEVYYGVPALASVSGESYYYGDAWAEYYTERLPQYADEFYSMFLSMPQSFYFPMTKADFYTNAKFESSPIAWNLDMWLWQITTGGAQYMWGSNFDPSSYPTLAAKGLTGRVDTLATTFGMEGVTLSIDTANIAFYSIGTPFTTNSQLKMNLYPMQYVPGQGYMIDHSTVLASAVATAADTVGTYSYQVQIDEAGTTALFTEGVINFPVKATITGEFCVEITGFNNNNTNIGFFADDISAGTTFHVKNGNYVALWSTSLALTFMAHEGTATPVANVKAEAAKAQKMLENGQVVILKDGAKFNVLGAQL